MGMGQCPLMVIDAINVVRAAVLETENPNPLTKDSSQVQRMKRNEIVQRSAPYTSNQPLAMLGGRHTMH